MAVTEGFMKQVGQELIAAELNAEPHQIFLWKIYTDVDMQ